ncbi:double-stranded RNA-specific editase 1 isoform X1 [Drosophila bipectinata]|uniref:double-stranded RNA-specific editase 1 isoform X1 n=1 Tax=Drosophila bipectinata TaxID=42026 RepID=UPI001C88E4FD|nr:double-stranded RNA-specific editase 1 isoform X2 [Drosophila bipectinata]KAH8236200.1 hypothetical protein KR026_007775 [Drosophila bipectinata]
MKRTRRPNNAGNKQFVSGGVYNPNANAQPLIQPPLQAANVVQNQPQAAPQPAPAPVAAPAPVQQQPQKKPDGAAIAAKLPMPILVKIEPLDVEAEPEPMQDSSQETDTDRDVTIDLSEENVSGGKIPFKKIFQKRKKSSERTRDKKQRQNRQLRKSMLPKNALMALNEVKGVTISDFTIDSNADGGFTAIVTVNSNQYEGKGLSKMSAKNAACEKAWRDFIIAKMTPKPPRSQPNESDNGDEAMDTNEDEAESPEDDLPMLNLASFAIYKLFAEWEREGFVVPEMHPNSAQNPNASGGGDAAPAAPAAPKEPKKPPIRSDLPPNWQTMHPATILCIMRPGITYVDYGTSGEKPNVVQHLGIVVDDQEFTASGRSKKIARRNVAVNVCNTLFGTNFTYENTA